MDAKPQAQGFSTATFLFYYYSSFESLETVVIWFFFFFAFLILPQTFLDNV